MSKSVSVDAVDWEGRTALHIAAAAGRGDVVDLLLMAGADINIKDKRGRTPGDDALPAVAKMLVNSSGRNSSNKNLSGHGDPQNPSVSMTSIGLRMEELCSMMAMMSEVSIVVDEVGRILIFNHAATELFGYSQLEIIGKNVSELCGPDDRPHHNSYMDRIVRTGERRVIGTAGRHVTAQHKDGTLMTILLSISEMRVGEHRVFIGNIHDLRGMKSGRIIQDFCRAAGNGDVKQVKQFLGDETTHKPVVLVNQGDYDKRTALHMAAAEGHLEVCKYLIRKGAHVNALDRWGGTPLADVIRTRSSKDVVAELLCKHGAQVFEDGRFIDMEASKLVLGDRQWEITPQEVDIIPGRLGQGSFGVVHKGLWRGTTVAVKRLLTDGDKQLGIIDDFRNEVLVMRQLHHPNIVQFYGAYLRQPPYMLVTEFLPGGNLEDDQLKRNKRMSTKRALNFARNVAAGLQYLHSLKPPIIHRDLKPANLLLDPNGVMKIADFGLAKVKHGKPNLPGYVMTGETGSYRYMAPEVFRHEKYTEKVDQYSFAVIFWEMIEGTMYLPYLKAIDVAYTSDAGHRPTFSREYRYGIRELIEACWDPVPEKRPTFADICTALDAIIDNKQTDKKCGLM